MKIDAIVLERELVIVEAEVANVLGCFKACLERKKFIEVLRENECFERLMQERQAMLLRYVNNINDIAMKAMAINDKDIVFKCEEIKRKVVDVMESVRNLYM